MDSKRRALERAKRALGGGAKLAEALSISRAAVSQWDEVPPLRVIAVERASGVSRRELRPDLYPSDETRA
jgi:DNA-binding transcriptional regulator YdaS (Cro superfamily)